MKRAFSYLVVSAAVLSVAGVSCIDKVNSYDAVRVISFKALRSTSTKSSAGGIAESAPFKVWGYSLPEEYGWDSACDMAQTVIEGDTFSCTDGCWKSASEYLWCDKGSRMSFFAVSPADASASFDRTNGVSVMGFSAANPLAADQNVLEFASIADVKKPVADEPTGISFTNALCEVEFRAMSVASDDIKLTVTKLTLSDVGTQGDFHSLPTPEWTITGDRKEVTVFDGEVVLGEDAKPLGGVLTMIPQNLRPKITLHYNFDSGTGGEIRDLDVELDRTMKWAVGKKRIYTFKVSQNLSLTIDSCITENTL